MGKSKGQKVGKSKAKSGSKSKSGSIQLRGNEGMPLYTLIAVVRQRVILWILESARCFIIQLSECTCLHVS